MSHEFEFVDREQTGVPASFGSRPHTMWTAHRCKTCGTLRTIIAGIPCYEPPGEEVQGFGQLEPPCPPSRT
jgi:hypothetical protein